MESPCRWANLYLLIQISLHVVTVFCQNIPLERISPEFSLQPQTGNLQWEVTQPPSPSKAQLIQALFSYASDNGLLSTKPQTIQSAPQEPPKIITSPATPTIFNVVPSQYQIPSNCFENGPIISSMPPISINHVMTQVSPPTTSYIPPTILQPRTETTSRMFEPKTCQSGLENTANGQPTVWHIPQPAQPATTINSCNVNPPVFFTDSILPYPNLQFSSPPVILPNINTDTTCGANFGVLHEEPLVVTSEDKPGIPINLQINIPPPNDQIPRLTIVTAAPPESHSNVSPFPPSPPIIVRRRSRSCLRKLLPIILLALIDDLTFGCPCGCCSDDPIPIPYPIPIPVNSPIIHS